MAVTNGVQKNHAEVIIIGAGPVGMLTALRLGQAGIKTIVIESHDTLLNTTRAMVYMPVVLQVLRHLGILDTVVEAAHLNTEGIAWRDVNGKQLARLPLANTDPYAHTAASGSVLLLGQWRMNHLILDALKQYSSVEVRFNQKLTSIDNDPSKQSVTVTANNPREPNLAPTQYTGRYVLGTDGANSATRRLLNIAFEGFTYNNFRMIGTDIAYDFTHQESFTPLNFTVHPTDWAVIAYTGQDTNGKAYNIDNPPQKPTPEDPSPALPMWRIAYAESPTLPNDPASIFERARAHVPKYISNKNSDSWTLLRAEPYTMQQRHASPPYKHNTFLAGDALHSNNPIGGLGLTGGILDAFCFGNAFIRVLKNSEPDSVLAACASSRVNTWKQVTDKLSQTNLERCFAEDDTEAGKTRHVLFGKLNGEQGEAVATATAETMKKSLYNMMSEDFAEGTEKYVSLST